MLLRTIDLRQLRVYGNHQQLWLHCYVVSLKLSLFYMYFAITTFIVYNTYYAYIM